MSAEISERGRGLVERLAVAVDGHTRSMYWGQRAEVTAERDGANSAILAYVAALEKIAEAARATVLDPDSNPSTRLMEALAALDAEGA